MPGQLLSNKFMSYFLIANNLHLGAELFGAVVFFLIAWLFFEAFWIKKDIFSLSRGFGFSLLSLWQFIHAFNQDGDGGALIAGGLIYLGGLLLILISYGLEKMAAKPLYAFMAPVPLFLKISGSAVPISAVAVTLITFLLAKRYFKDIDKPIKWLMAGFGILSAAALITLLTVQETPGLYWIAGHLIKLAAFFALSVWIWKFLSLRIREEALIVFIAISLFISLLVTTTFSIFFLRRIQNETENSLSANSQILNFYIASLKNKALAASQIIAASEDLAEALKSKDAATLQEISGKLLQETSGEFLTIAGKKGEIFLKSNFPVVKEENVLAEKIGAEALEGRPSVTISQADIEGLSIRAAAPIMDRGAIIGAAITGSLLNKNFVRQFKDISDFETSIFKDNRVSASSFLLAGQPAAPPAEKYIGPAELAGQQFIGAFQPIKNTEGKTIAVFSLTTTPGELLRNAQAANRLTMIIIFSITLSLMIPLYRFSVFLTSDTI